MATLLTTTVNGDLTTTGNVAVSGQVNLFANTGTVPPTNNTAIFGMNVAGRIMPATVSNLGYKLALQPHFGMSRVATWNFIGNQSTVPVALGMQAPTIVGTATSRTMAATSIFASVRRIGYLSAATAGSNCSIRTGAANFLFGNTTSAILGSTTAVCRFGVSDPAVVANAMMFVGFTSTTGQIANATNTAAMTFVIGVGQKSGSNTLQIITNNSGAAAFLIDTGLLCNVGNTNIWDVRMYIAPNVASVGFQITDLANTSNTYSTTVTANGTNVPTGNVLMSWQQWRTNNTAASVVGMDCINTYIESDM